MKRTSVVKGSFYWVLVLSIVMLPVPTWGQVLSMSEQAVRDAFITKNQAVLERLTLGQQKYTEARKEMATISIFDSISDNVKEIGGILDLIRTAEEAKGIGDIYFRNRMVRASSKVSFAQSIAFDYGELWIVLYLSRKAEQGYSERDRYVILSRNTGECLMVFY